MLLCKSHTLKPEHNDSLGSIPGQSDPHLAPSLPQGFSLGTWLWVTTTYVFALPGLGGICQCRSWLPIHTTQKQSGEELQFLGQSLSGRLTWYSRVHYGNTARLHTISFSVA